MGNKSWFYSKKYPGIRWFLGTRNYGAVPDRCYQGRYQVAGRRVEEVIGWASEGMTEAKAALELERLKQAARLGEGHSSLAERREITEIKRRAETEAQEQERKAALTFAEAFLVHYLPFTSQTKSPRSLAREKSIFRLWLEPVLGHRRLGDIAPIHVERVRRNMRETGLSLRSLHYAVQVIRQVYHHATRMRLYPGPAPTRDVKSEKQDRRRLRFLSREEANRLMDALADVSPDLRDMALLSLRTGMRAGEVFALTWGDVDMDHGMLTLRDTKSGRSRHAFMTADIKTMLAARARGQANDLVFPSRTGERRAQISKRFNMVVDQLGLNGGIDDPRQKVVFHTLRHTFASWLVMNGEALYTVAKLLGHESISMTERYSHLAPDHLRAAINSLEVYSGVE